MNEEDELFKKCFIKTLKKLAEEPDEVINYNEQLKKYNNLLKEKIKLQQELQRKDNIMNELKKWLEVKEEKETIGTFSDVLDKINKLEGDNK